MDVPVDAPLLPMRRRTLLPQGGVGGERRAEGTMGLVGVADTVGVSVGPPEGKAERPGVGGVGRLRRSTKRWDGGGQVPDLGT